VLFDDVVSRETTACDCGTFTVFELIVHINAQAQHDIFLINNLVCILHCFVRLMHAHAMQSSCYQKAQCYEPNRSPHRGTPFSFGQSADLFGFGSHTSTIADHTSSVADTLDHLPNQRYTHIQSKRATEKMSFEPKTKVELDPPKNDIISLDYLSKCDGELDFRSYSSTTTYLNMSTHRHQPRLPYLRRHQRHRLRRDRQQGIWPRGLVQRYVRA
jgi:hypothetical protein